MDMKAFESVVSSLDRNEVERNGVPHLMVSARAGTGKTTTLVEGIVGLKGPTAFAPTPQQERIWQEMRAGGIPQSVCFCAFNVSIANELSTRVPSWCYVKTIHGMGFQILRESYPGLTVDVRRNAKVTRELLRGGGYHIKQSPRIVNAVSQLVSLCKLTVPSRGEWFRDDTQLTRNLLSIRNNYCLDPEVEENWHGIPSLVRDVLDAAFRMDRRVIDYDDMVWLPRALGCRYPKYDLLLVDEAQDLNEAQRALVLSKGRRIIFCGDEHQAIYGFAGATPDSMNRIKEVLGDCRELPLTVTRRCPRSVVVEAKKYVPDIEARVDSKEGMVSVLSMGDEPPEACYNCLGVGGVSGKVSSRNGRLTPCPSCGGFGRTKGGYLNYLSGGSDMVLCRKNAPLVSECHKAIKRGVPALVVGRDVGKGLIDLLDRLLGEVTNMFRYEVMGELGELALEWCRDQIAKEMDREDPREHYMDQLVDKRDCFIVFCKASSSVQDMRERIETMFTHTGADDKKAVRFSSIHKAKGMEADNVFLLQPDHGKFFPSPRKKAKPGQEWREEEEKNLLYVAITRAIKNLFYVRPPIPSGGEGYSQGG